jgi:hypothetical protein
LAKSAVFIPGMFIVDYNKKNLKVSKKGDVIVLAGLLFYKELNYTYVKKTEYWLLNCLSCCIKGYIGVKEGILC